MIREGDNSGFTLMEMMIVVMVSIPLLATLVTTSKAVGGAIKTNERTADVTNKLEETIAKIGRFVRPASVSTVETKATATDVTTITAEEEARLAQDASYVMKVPAAGDWIARDTITDRASLRMRAPQSILSLNMAAMTTPRELAFELDAGETDNDQDDDGDGLVDEGQLYLTYEGTRILLADGVEACRFTVDGAMVRVAMTLARSDGRRVIRASLVRTFYMHND